MLTRKIYRRIEEFYQNRPGKALMIIGARQVGKSYIVEEFCKTHYESFVSYWMCFLGHGYGLHDASWRSNFGGDIYKYSGSHGCVNLPTNKAPELYNLISVGTVVIIHN